ncbi:hypothetical protein [Laspinema olomoucense]|nr:hypothetical protein [Laspinema sp. D3b]
MPLGKGDRLAILHPGPRFSAHPQVAEVYIARRGGVHHKETE